jgi:hypothetical protein
MTMMIAGSNGLKITRLIDKRNNVSNSSFQWSTFFNVIIVCIVDVYEIE